MCCVWYQNCANKCKGATIDITGAGTPSNSQYIDKNYGQIFIFWDKWFGTFQEELKDVPPVYGITRPVRTWNPIKINFQHAWGMIKDAWRTNSWKDKFTLWFKPTGYRPADVAAKYPVYKIEDVYNFEKYETNTSTALNAWCWIQMIITLLFVSYLFGNIAMINGFNKYYILLYGGFIFLTVYALSDLMDNSNYAIGWELARAIMGIGLIYYLGDWFGINTFYSWASYALMGYFVLSAVITGWFVYTNGKQASPVLMSS